MATETLQIEMNARGDATKAVKNLGAAGRDTSKSLKASLIPSLLKTAAVLGAIKIAARAVGGVLKSLTTGFIDAGDEMIKTARAFGVSVEELSQLRAQAELSSIEFNAMLMASKKLAAGVDELRKGAGETVAAWDFFGITMEDVEKNGTSLNQVMELLADRVSELPDSLAKANAAGDLFGQRVGGKLIPLLNQGSGALRDQIKLFIELGGIMTTGQAAAAEKAADAMALLNIAFRGLRNEIGSQVAPVVEDLILKFLDFFKKVRPQLGFFLRSVPLVFKAVFLTVRELVQEGLGGDLLGEILAKFGLLAVGIVKVVARAAGTIWEPLLTEFKIISFRIVNFFADQVGNKLVADIANLPRNLGLGLRSAMSELPKAVQKAVRLLIPAVGALEDVSKQIPEIEIDLFPTLDEAELRSLTDKIRGETQGAGQAAAEAARGILVQFKGLFDQLTSAGANFPQLQKVFIGIAAALKQARREAAGLVDELETGTPAALSDWKKFLGMDENGKVQSGEGFLGALKQIKADLNNVGAQGAKIGQDLVATLGGALEDGFFNVIDGGFTSLKDSFNDFLSDVLRGLAKIAAQQVINQIITTGISAIPGLAKGGVVSGNLQRTVPVQAYQGGGVASSPQLALFGEGPRAEAFIPLGPNRKVGVELEGGGAQAAPQMNVNFQVQAIDAQSFATFLGRTQNQAMLKNLVIDAVNSDSGFHQALNRRR